MIEDMHLCSNKCRLCLSNEEFQIPIFGEVAQKMQICLKIRTCLPIKVSQEDDFPKNICYKCVAALEQSYNLWKVSAESEAVLKNLTSKANQDFSEANIQYQGCQSIASRLDRAPSQANRRLVLPTGISLMLESDSEEEHGQAAQMDSPKILSAERVTASGPESTEWLWESDAVMMDTSPDFLDSLSEPSPHSPSNVFCRQTSKTVKTNSSPHIVESLSKPAPNIRDMRSKERSPSSRWRSISLFGKSSSTWRDLFRHRDERDDIHSIPGSPSVITGGAATEQQRGDNRSYEDGLQAMNERNCKAISQCGDTPRALLNFLRTQKPLDHEDLDIPQQGPE